MPRPAPEARRRSQPRRPRRRPRPRPAPTRRPTTTEVPTGNGTAGPVRTCVGCRRRAHPDGLVRLTRRPDGSLVVGKGPGRGAWLCGPPATVTCLETAVGRRALERALRGPVATDTIERLRTTLRE